MKTFTLTFECNNEVFADYPEDATADALMRVSKRVRQHGLFQNEAFWIIDNNGNRIGTYKYEVR